MSKDSHMSPAQRAIYDSIIPSIKRRLRNEILTLIFMIGATVLACTICCAMFYTSQPSERLLTEPQLILLMFGCFNVPILLIAILQARSVFRVYREFCYTEIYCMNHPLATMTAAELQENTDRLQSLVDQQHQLQADFQQQNAELQQQIDSARATPTNQDLDCEFALRQQLLALQDKL